MTILEQKRGDELHISNCLRLIILETRGCCVKFGVLDRTLSQTGGILSAPLAELCRNKSCYFLFPKSGCCTLVITCAKGQTISLTGTACAKVLNIEAEKVTLAVTGLALFGTSESYMRQKETRRAARVRRPNARETHQFKSGKNLMQPVHTSPSRFWRQGT